MIKNLTPHLLHIETADGSFIDIEPEGYVPRLAQTHQRCGQVTHGAAVFNVTEKSFGELQGMPRPIKNINYVVPELCAMHPDCRDRRDVYFPGAAIRDDNGRIIGCRGLSRVSPLPGGEQ